MPHNVQRTCDYCGLPIAGFRRAETEKSTAPEYCCTGCSFAAKITSESGSTGEERLAMTKLGLAVFFAMSVMVFSLVLWSESDALQARGTELALAASFYDVARYLSLLFTIPVLFLLGAPVVENALADLRRGRLSTDFLLAIGVAASFGYSAYHVFLGAGHVYFEVACAILVAVTLGKWLEAHCKRQMTESLSALARLLPASVARLNEEGEPIWTPLAKVRRDELLRISGGERIAVDGVIVKGQSLIDEQILTGESEPVSKGPDDRVLAGALNLDGELVIRSTVAGGEGAIARIVESVTRAAQSKSKSQVLAEHLSGWFLPVVIAMATGTFAYHASAGGTYLGISNALCVVLIACPCALGLATPLGIWAGIGRASRSQILVRDGDALCQLGKVKVIAVDKTGTLTTGAQLVTLDSHAPQWKIAEIQAIARRMAEGSNHLYSKAIAREYEHTAPVDVESLRIETGRGIVATLCKSKERVVLGSRRFFNELGFQFDRESTKHFDKVEAQGLGLSMLGVGNRVVASFSFNEQLRDGAADLVKELRQQNIEVVILSGDHARRVDVVARRLNTLSQAELLPEQKLAAIGRLRQKFGRVAMIGDGVNDAPALAVADVGIALGCGADVSREAAGVCLIGSQLSRVAEAIEIGRRTTRTVQWNLVWTFAYNLAGLTLAVTGRLHPAVAAGAMVASSLMVVMQSLRLANMPLESNSNPHSTPADSDTRRTTEIAQGSVVLQSSSALA